MEDPLAFPSALAAGDDVTMRLAHDGDAGLIAEWLRAPEVARSWGGGRAVTVDEVMAKYTGRRVPGVVSYLVSEGIEPVGYLQAWQQEGRFGLDMFIAAEAQGRGLGPRAARALATDLAARGWVPLTVDPAIDNPRAVKAWLAAGFVPTGQLGTDEGRTTQIMKFRGEQAAHTPA
jgi:aminoglycoside 6'-N-acetyltransferase